MEPNDYFIADGFPHLWLTVGAQMKFAMQMYRGKLTFSTKVSRRFTVASKWATGCHHVRQEHSTLHPTFARNAVRRNETRCRFPSPEVTKVTRRLLGTAILQGPRRLQVLRAGREEETQGLQLLRPRAVHLQGHEHGHAPGDPARGNDEHDDPVPHRDVHDAAKG